MANHPESHIQQGVFEKRSSPKEPNPGPVPMNRLRKLGVAKTAEAIYSSPNGVGPVSKESTQASNQRKTW